VLGWRGRPFLWLSDICSSHTWLHTAASGGPSRNPTWEKPCWEKRCITEAWRHTFAIC